MSGCSSWRSLLERFFVADLFSAGSNYLPFALKIIAIRMEDQCRAINIQSRFLLRDCSIFFLYTVPCSNYWIFAFLDIFKFFFNIRWVFTFIFFSSYTKMTSADEIVRIDNIFQVSSPYYFYDHGTYGYTCRLCCLASRRIQYRDSS